jgi:hypothetical protein
MSDSQLPQQGHRVEPARPVDGAELETTAVECPHCHATTVGDVAFCGACGYDFVTGTPPRPDRVTDEDDGEDAPRVPTALQAAEPLEAYIDPRRDADDIELPTTAEEVGLGPDDLHLRVEVPPPSPPSAEQTHVVHDRPEHRPPSREHEGPWVAEVWVDHAWYATRDTDQPVPDAGPPEVVPLTSDNVVIGRTNVERGLHPDLDAGTDAGVSVRHAQLTSDGRRWWVEDLDTSNGTYVSTVGLPLPQDPVERGLRVEIDEDDRVYLGGWTRLVLRRADVGHD